jgi:hypothetical protein
MRMRFDAVLGMALAAFLVGCGPTGEVSTASVSDEPHGGPIGTDALPSADNGDERPDATAGSGGPFTVEGDLELVVEGTRRV